MEKSRSLVIFMLGLACLFLLACKTGGTPTRSDSTPAKSRATAAPQAPPPAASAGQKRTASFSGHVGSAISKQRKDLTGKAVDRLGNRSGAVIGKPIRTMRAILYAVLAVIFTVVIGAITAEHVTRRRKLTPSALNARN